jgi:hypothetical protein
LDIRTHNGDVDYAGQTVGSPSGISVHKRAGGSSMENAREALAAMEIVSERVGGDLKLSWRWKGDKRSRWVGVVAFRVQGPNRVNLAVETHNGEVKAAGLAGNVKIVSHNGMVNVDSRDGTLEAVTHNGGLHATYAGSQLRLETHNGTVRADLRQCGPLRGDIHTHNGAVEVQVGPQTAAEIVARTSNGSVTSQAPIEVKAASRTRLEGRLGTGGEKLDISTHNGSVQIKAG